MATSSITAGTTRTQAGATLLTDSINRVDTSTAVISGVGDGVILPVEFAGTDQRVIINNTANNIQLYANGTDTINGVAGSVGVAVGPNVIVMALMASPGKWQAMGGATPTTTLTGGGGGGGGGSGSVTSVGITSTDLTVTGGPITTSGNIDVELKAPVAITKGGTGLTTLGTAGQVLTVSPDALSAIWSTPNVLAGAVTVLDKNGAAQSVTSTTTETALHTTNVTAGSMSAHGGVIAISRWSYTNNADVKNLHVRLGGISGTDFFGFGPTTTNTVEVMTIIQNRGVTNQQIGDRLGTSGLGSSASAFTTGSLDTTVAQSLVFSAAPTSTTDSITLESCIVLVF